MTPTMPLVFALPGSQLFGGALALATNAELGRLSMREFPDGETYVRLETNPAGRAVTLVATLARPNEKLAPLLLVAGAARQLGATRVGLVSPYLAYMRQDAAFHAGEAVSAKILADVISSSVDWLVTVDPHLHRIQRLTDIYRIPAVVAHAGRPIGAWIREQVSSPFIIGPDSESQPWARTIARACDAPFVILEKVRRGDEDVRVSAPDLSGLAGRTPVIVDDIISSGRTMLAVLETLRHTRPAPPPAMCVAVHALFHAGVYDLLRAAGAARVVTTNSIPHFSNGIDIVPAVAEALSSAILLERPALSLSRQSVRDCSTNSDSPRSSGAVSAIR